MRKELGNHVIRGWKNYDREVKIGSIIADSDGKRYEVRSINGDEIKAVKQTYSNPLYTLSKKQVALIQE